MNEQFTTGPWLVEREKNDDAFYVRVNRTHAPTVCKLTPNKSDEESEANANLIAAAPEMYEALKKISDLLDGYFQSKDELVPAEIVEAYEIIESTLLKANP